VYTTVSSRRFASDLQDAHARGHLSTPGITHFISREKPLLYE
jgi:hypothetical protein